MLREFKAFILKENVLALAIAVVLGGAFGKVVTAVVDDEPLEIGERLRVQAPVDSIERVRTVEGGGEDRELRCRLRGSARLRDGAHGIESTAQRRYEGLT